MVNVSQQEPRAAGPRPGETGRWEPTEGRFAPWHVWGGGKPELRCRVMEVDDDDVDCYCFGDELHALMGSIRGHSMNVVDTSVLRQMTGQ